MILSPADMRSLEERAFADGITAEALMEDAGARIAEAVWQFFPTPGRCVVHFGKGHNGGDALVAGRHLAASGWKVELVPAFPIGEWTPLTRKMFATVEDRGNRSDGRTLILLDGLLGIGAGGPLREPIASAAAAINRRRVEENAQVIAIDLPTGLDAETGAANPSAVRADFTFTIGFAKLGLVADGAAKCVGRLAVLPLRELTARADFSRQTSTVATGAALASLLPRRAFDLHKGECGRVTIIAGSRGLTGAALMSAEACTRAGSGLVTLLVTEDIYPIVAAAASPEIMVKPVASYREIFDLKYDVVALGPGLGLSRKEELLDLIRRIDEPMILDADGLNAVAEDLEALDHCAGPRLLTPHPGEMARLDPSSAKRSRAETVQLFTKRHPHTLLLKGARTLIGEHGWELSYNSTGSPGMATGGMGDVLTGVCAALAGQGLPLYHAARIGAWLCGRAAELAISSGRESEESLVPPAIFRHLGAAFSELRAGRY